jgi:hypothetical protein
MSIIRPIRLYSMMSRVSHFLIRRTDEERTFPAGGRSCWYDGVVRLLAYLRLCLAWYTRTHMFCLDRPLPVPTWYLYQVPVLYQYSTGTRYSLVPVTGTT